LGEDAAIIAEAMDDSETEPAIPVEIGKYEETKKEPTNQR
jgi:hypothetical protein